MSLLLLGFVALMCLLPLRTAVLIGADEGFALSKATLYLKGYKFYTEVWNDQPLLHTILIAQASKFLDASVLGPRLLTALFAVVLLTSVYFLCLKSHGLAVAGLTPALLIASPGFLELASSCMVELPAIALPVAALVLLGSDFFKKSFSREIAAGFLFGIGLHIKFNAVIYLPVAVLALWLQHRQKGSSGKSLTKSVLALIGALAGSFVVVHSLIDEGSYALLFKQSWESHIASTRSFEYGSPEEHPFPWSLLLNNWDTTLPAALGIIYCCRRWRHNAMAILVVAWLAVTLIAFVPHRPWWPYYYLHNSIPLCWCAAIGIQALYQRIRSLQNRALRVLLILFCSCAWTWAGSRLYLEIKAIRDTPQIYGSLVLKEIEPLKPFCTSMFTDQPVYSFHADIPLPPKLAVLSLKRMWSGEMTNDRLAAELEAAKPGIMLLANNTHDLPYRELLQRDYRMVYEDAEFRLFVLQAVLHQAAQAEP